MDVGLVVSMAWLLCALGVTALIAPDLGLRGLFWMVLHHIVCLVGSVHEIRRAWLRRQRAEAEQALRDNPATG